MLTSNDIINAEFFLSIILAVALLLYGFIWPKMGRAMILTPIFIYLIFILQRPIDYNSDTANYYVYYSLIESMSVIDALLVKLEPFHYLVANFSSSFYEWIFLEMLIYFVIVAKLIGRQSIVSVGVIVGATLPLMSSSFRFAMGVLACAYVYSILIKNKTSTLASGLIGGGVHISMLAAPFVMRFSWNRALVILMVVIAAPMVPWLVERFSLEQDISTVGMKLVGVKTLLVTLIFYLYQKIKFRNIEDEYRNSELKSFIILIILLFVAANLSFQMANRWMVLSLTLNAIRFDCLNSSALRDRVADSVFGCILFSFLALPQVVFIYLNQGWME